MQLVLYFVVLVSCLWGPSINGAYSSCPSRELLYPCYCTTVPLTKKTSFTVVTCSYVQSTSSLDRIQRTLRSMVIDRFIILDSFWHSGDDHSTFPQNWFSLMRIKDLEIIDSQLSPDFACSITDGCPNVQLTRLTVRNSTSKAIKFVCKNGQVYWTSCLTKLRHVSFSHNQLETFNRSVFPTDMEELLTLNLSYNRIASIGPSSFAKLHRLTALDLSNNLLKSIDGGIFGSRQIALKHLDLSWNSLSRIPPDVLRSTPFLESFIARGNLFKKIPEEDWKVFAGFKTIKLIDFQDNYITCDCHLVWINCTLKVHTNVLGSCAEGYENTPLRRVSKYMSERCTETGVLEQRANGTKGNACLGWWKIKNKSSEQENRVGHLLESPLPVVRSILSEASSRRRHRQPSHNP